MVEKKIKTKQHITITVDTEVYLKARLTEGLNLSQTINDFLIKYFESEEEGEEKLKKDLKELQKQQILIEYELTKKERQREKELQEKISEKNSEIERLKKAVPTGKDFYSKLTREKMLAEHPELKEYIESIINKDEVKKK